MHHGNDAALWVMLTREVVHCQNGMTGAANLEEEQSCAERISDQLFIVKRK